MQISKPQDNPSLTAYPRGACRLSGRLDGSFRTAYRRAKKVGKHCVMQQPPRFSGTLNPFLVCNLCCAFLLACEVLIAPEQIALPYGAGLTAGGTFI